jgi:hypothetical protein
MANTKISALPAAATLVGTELVPLVQSGATVAATARNIAGLSSKAVALSSFGTLHNDGATDDSAVLIAAIASGARNIDARGLNIAILATVALATGTYLDLAGSTITTTGSTITTFSATSVDDWAVTGPFTIVGAGSTVGTAKGFSIAGCKRWTIDGYTAKTIKGHAMFLTPGTPNDSFRGDQGKVTDFLAYQCWHGWEDSPGAGAEYCNIISGSVVASGDWGVTTCAGNITWTGGNISDNVGDGLKMAGGTNHAHGIFTGVQINHNGTNNLNASGIINGESFIGCHFYEKIVLLDGCNGMTFAGCMIDTPTITVNSGAGSGQSRFQGVNFQNAYGNPAAIGGTDPTSLVLKDCYGPGNPGNNDIVVKSISADYTYLINDEALVHDSADTTARTVTVNSIANLKQRVGKVLSGDNMVSAGVITLAITTDVIVWLPTGVTGSRTVAAGGNWALKLVKIAAGVGTWHLTGSGIT